MSDQTPLIDETADPTTGFPLPKLALFGPLSPPFRGGIAQYTSSLRKALFPRCELKTISFKRLYPAWLYPGASDREPGMEHVYQSGVLYTLDALDPRTLRKAVHDIAADHCDLTVINWWTLFWAPGLAWMARRLRARGVPVAFLCHNLFDHDSGVFKRILATHFLSQADAYLVHTSAQADSLKQMFPAKVILLHPHPTYDNYPPPGLILPKRGRLELLFFGFIRPYKGLDVLIDALALLVDRDVYLTVIGEPWCKPEELEQRVRESGAPNVELHLEYMEASTAADYFARADIVVLPYRKATGSGVAAMAAHYDKPVLATRAGGFSDVIEHGHTGFLVDPDSPQQLAAAVQKLDRNTLAPLAACVREYKNRFTWASLADTLVELAQTMTSNNPTQRRRPPMAR